MAVHAPISRGFYWRQGLLQEAIELSYFWTFVVGAMVSGLLFCEHDELIDQQGSL